MSALKQKTEDRRKADEASASKAKIRRSVSMNRTIQEGHNYVEREKPSAKSKKN